MSYVKTRLGRFTQRTFEAGSLVILLVLLGLPFTRAFADDFRFGGGPGISQVAGVQGWRLGGGYRSGGYEIYRWTPGGWRRVPGRGVQLGGNSRNPWIVNSQGERYQWTGRDWRFVGYANGRGFNNHYSPPPVYRNDHDRDRYRWDRDRDRRDYDRDRRDRNDHRNNNRDNHGNVIRQQQNRIERQQDRIQDLRQDLLRERAEDRRDDRRDNRNDARREDRHGDRGDGRQVRSGNEDGRNDNHRQPDRDGGRP
ncbi:MAG: hypothetical protein R3F41_17515 [Gammaproteobacteria bacterium]|nr:hypothetical protein [Pseudomonadales bacterium]MCP5347348.1 hypothetical protein [Pseudomonadales bacterium]